ncbi:MAG: class I adenylate-forming enzyme family protein [Caulobacter sp.]
MSVSSSPAWPAVSIAEAHARLTAAGSPFETVMRPVRGQRLPTWANGPQTMRDVLARVREHGDRTFVVLEDERVSYAAFHRAVARLARELTDMGVGPGDRVAVTMRNLPEWPVAVCAAAAISAIATPLNAWWSREELLYGLRDSGAKVAVFDPERLARVVDDLAGLPDLWRVFVARGDGSRPALEDLIGPVAAWADLPDADLPPGEIDPDAPATLFYTSGTTGRPKGALGSHRGLTSNILTQQFVAARSFLRRGEVMPPRPADAPQRATLLAVPLFHVTGFAAIMTPMMFNGDKMVLMRRFDATAALQLIERERITTAGGVPTIAWQLVDHPERDRYDLSSLERIAYGGAPCPPELQRRVREVWPHATPSAGWGMTETCAVFANNTAEDYLAKPESCGPPTPLGTWKIMRPDGEEAATGEIGELWVRGCTVAIGYWNNPQATEETFGGGWLRTGDLARLDEDGFAYIVDRAKDMLIRGGENIYCIEVENLLAEHPAVDEAALIGLPHRTLGEEPGAVVRLRPGARADEATLRAFVGSRLAGFKVPVRVFFVTEPLPRNANGKIIKAELRDRFAQPAPASA